jgi:predicted DNA-binding transcriptional regulator AlpA
MTKMIKAEPLRRQLEMSRSTFDRIVAERRHGFPAPHYIGRHRFFDLAEIDTWLRSLQIMRAEIASALMEPCICNEPAYLIGLAAALENIDEVTLGRTDAHYASVALRHYAAFLGANAP